MNKHKYYIITILHLGKKIIEIFPTRIDVLTIITQQHK